MVAEDVNYNRAIAYYREGEKKKALELLPAVSGDTHAIALIELEVDCHLELKNPGAAAQAVERWAERWIGKAEDIEDSQISAQAKAMDAKIFWAKGERDTALQKAWESIAIRKNNQVAARLIREIENDKSTDTRNFRARVNGAWPHKMEGIAGPVGFLSTYDVAAESLEKVLGYIKRFEPAEVADSLVIYESFDNGPAPEVLKGVL